jgi:hypothetical protein
MNDIELLHNWCFGCDNHRKSLNGPICKITEKRPDFINTCTQYVGNNEKLRKSQQKLIEINLKDDRYFEKIKPTFITKELKNLPNELILRNKKFDLNLVYLLLLDLIGAYFFHYLKNDTLHILNLEFLKIFGFITIFSIPIFGFIFAKMSDQSEQITLSKTGIKIQNGALISWTNCFTYILTKYANTDGKASWMRKEFLVIKKPFEKEILVSIDSLEKKPSDLSNLMENYKKNVP